MNRIDITGNVYGRLTALHVAEASRQKGKGTVWEFRCSCGTTHYSTAGNVNAGRTKSCGCLSREEKVGRETPLLPHRFWAKFLKLAERRNLTVEVTAQDLEAQWHRQKGICPYSGRTLTLPKTSADVRNPNYNASVDRIDSSKGYVRGNIQWVLTAVNFMKQNVGHDDFLSLCREIVSYQEEQ